MILENPQMASEAGISLSDTEQEIVKKVADWEYNTEVRGINNSLREQGIKSLTEEQMRITPPDKSFTYTDSRGVDHYFELPDETKWQLTTVDVEKC